MRNDFKLDYFEDVDDLDFVNRQAPEDFTMIRCQIIVHANKLTTNDYELWLENYPRDSPLLWSQSKRAAVTGVSISINTNLITDTQSTTNKYKAKKIGKLKSDLNRFTYELTQVSEHDFTLQSAQLFFRKQSLTSPTPKELDVFLRALPHGGDLRGEHVFKLGTKSPEYDRASKSYKLDFHGRAKKVSYNNMQISYRPELEDSSSSSSSSSAETERIVWQLGKVRKNHYILDYAYPFTMFTAFGTALTCMTK